MDAAELAANEQKGRLSFGQLGLRASRLRLSYYREDQEEEEEREGKTEVEDGGR